MANKYVYIFSEGNVSTKDLLAPGALIYLSGMENIRDVIPYPRTPQNCEF